MAVKDKEGRTPLRLTAASNNKEVVQLLLDNGGDVDAQDKDGEPPLHAAAQSGQKEAVQLLLDHGAEIDA